MTASGMPYDDEEENGDLEEEPDREAEPDDEEELTYVLECDAYRAVLMIQRKRKLWEGSPVS